MTLTNLRLATKLFIGQPRPSRMPKAKTIQRIDGKWSRPVRKTLVKYAAIVLLGLVIDFGSKALVHSSITQRTPLFLGVNLESVFFKGLNPPAFTILAFVFLTTWLVFLPLFLRLSERWLDEWWLAASALMFGGLLGSTLEQIAMGGVYYIFSVTGGLRFLCIGRGLRFSHYYWNPPDLYASIYAYSLIILLLAYYLLPNLVSGKHNPNQRRAR